MNDLRCVVLTGRCRMADHGSLRRIASSSASACGSFTWSAPFTFAQLYKLTDTAFQESWKTMATPNPPGTVHYSPNQLLEHKLHLCLRQNLQSNRDPEQYCPEE